MKIYTQEDFDLMPAVNGVRQCPTGDYTNIRIFAERCSFGAKCRFSKCSFDTWCSFGEECCFEAGCSFSKNCSFGERCKFSEMCVFGYSCSFGECGSFRESCSFEAGCSFGEKSVFEYACNFGDGCGFGEHCVFGKCSFGASCSFSVACSFAENCDFNIWCAFGERCFFGKKCSFENGHKALLGYPILSFGGGGSVNRTLYAFNVENGPLVRAGCFLGTLDKFREKVLMDNLVKPNKVKTAQYLSFANIVAATWCPEKIENEHFCYLEKSSS